jgi:hypothetical protein
MQLFGIEIGQDDLSSRRTVSWEHESHAGADSHRSGALEGFNEVNFIASKHHEIDRLGEFIPETSENRAGNRSNVDTTVGGQGKFGEARPYAVGTGSTFLNDESEGAQGAEESVSGRGYDPEQLSSVIDTERAPFADGFDQQKRVFRSDNQIRIRGFLHSRNAITEFSRGGK